MAESLVKQIVDLKEEHSLMLDALKFNEHFLVWWEESDMKDFTENLNNRKDKALEVTNVAIKAAEEGNKRRLERGNVELP
jgi:hypothetical protein